MKLKSTVLIFILCFCLSTVSCQAPVAQEWAAVPTEYDAYTENTVIFTGTVLNTRQRTVKQNPITTFDMEITEVLSCRSGSFKPGDTVRVGVGYNNSNHRDEYPVIKEGTSYLAFSYVMADEETDSLGLSEYVDLWVGDPRLLFVEKVGEHYLANKLFFEDIPGALPLGENSDFPEAAAVLEEREKRANKNYSGMLHLDIYSLIDCKVLEEHIKTAALEYK